MTRYLLMPLRSTPLILVAIFGVLWDFAIMAKFTGIPADFILVSWFFKYCFVLLDSVVAGHEELPVGNRGPLSASLSVAQVVGENESISSYSGHLQDRVAVVVAVAHTGGAVSY